MYRTVQNMYEGVWSSLWGSLAVESGKWLQRGSSNHKEVTFSWERTVFKLFHVLEKSVLLLLSTLCAALPGAVQGTCLRCFLGIWFGRGPPFLPAGIWSSVQRRVTHSSRTLLSLLADILLQNSDLRSKTLLNNKFLLLFLPYKCLCHQSQTFLLLEPNYSVLVFKNCVMFALFFHFVVKHNLTSYHANNLQN